MFSLLHVSIISSYGEMPPVVARQPVVALKNILFYSGTIKRTLFIILPSVLDASIYTLLALFFFWVRPLSLVRPQASKKGLGYPT
jgi:hypothetical protein